jgi:predicted nucleic acid-binding protein
MSKQPETRQFVYFDTAPLVQLYLYQAKLTEQAQLVFTSTEQVVVSHLCLPEFMGAIRGAVQGKGLKKNIAKRITGEFRETWKAFTILDMPPSIFERAAEFAEEHPVKASDALHLAAFEGFKAREESAYFFTTDIQQFRVAQLLHPNHTIAVVW